MSNLKKALDKDYSYPDPNNEDFLNDIYEKREFYNYRGQEPVVLENYADLKKFRDVNCNVKLKTLQPHQIQLTNYITPDTPFRGILCDWDTGAGKTGATVTTLEAFTDMVLKYGTKIHILVPGRILKETWKDEIIKFTGEKYMKDLTQTLGYVGEEEREQEIKHAKSNLSQFYKIMSHVAFYKKVLGQKIIEHVKEKDADKISKVYRKTSQGEYERDIATDRIESLDNTVLVVDEAHHIVGNEYGLAVKTIIRNSKNLRVILLSATPMKNLADDIIELVNYLRPEDDQIDRDLVFTNHKNHLMDYKPGGREYLGRMLRGYVSYSRGASQYLYAKQVDMGEIPKELMYTSLIQCEMSPFQEMAYKEAIESSDDTLDRKSTAVSNFAFPVYQDGKLVGKYGLDGLNALRTCVKTNKTELYEHLKKLGVKGNEFIVDVEKFKTIRGDILKKENVGIFSAKFKEALTTMDNMVNDNAGLGFIFSNFVKTGTELFEQTMIENGYLEYSPDNNYTLLPNTKHYYTGEIYSEYMKKGSKEKFYPATYVVVTGGTEDEEDQIPEEKKKIIDSVFSIPENSKGKFIKFIIGSKVMTEGITLRNILRIIILDTAYHLGQIAQVVGRGIRFCVHMALMDEDNPYPNVYIHKLIVKVKGSNQLSTEGILYQKAELKYILVKDVERLIQENAFDCAQNYNNNLDKNMVKAFENCIPPLEYAKLDDDAKKQAVQCPMKCEFQNCMYVCNSKKLNFKHYDKNSKLYKKINKANLDFSTFTSKLAKNEINFCKNKIKEMYRFKYVYRLEEILENVKKSFTPDQAELFENYFCYQALNDLVLITENDFNNFTSTIYDKFNVPGYLIYRNRYYIFQPLNQNEDVPMYYRTNYSKDLIEELTLNQYFKNSLDSKIVGEFQITDNDDIQYDFDNVLEYYDSKPEAKYVGIIDKPLTRKKTIKVDNNDIFKIREQKQKNLTKKRGTGIPSLKGSVCYTSKDKKYLIKIAKYIGLKEFNTDTRMDICEVIRLRMMYLEKYSTVKDNNKLTWVIIPYNHPKYKFPLNLEDNVSNIMSKLSEKITTKVNIKESNGGIFEGVRNNQFKKYILTFTHKDDWNIFTDFFISLGFVLKSTTWELTVE